MASDETKDFDETKDLDDTEERPAECVMLDILDKDIREGRVQPIPQSLLDRARELTEGIEVDLDEPLEGDIDLYDPLVDTLEAERSTKH
jgi:hypothetical protein